MNQLHYHHIAAKKVLRAVLSTDRHSIFQRFKCMGKVSSTLGQDPVENHGTRISITLRRYATDSSRRPIPKRFKRAPLPFEINASANTDVLLYSYHQKERLCLLITLGGIFLFCVLLNSAELIYMTLGSMKETPTEEKKYPWYYWWRNINFNSSVIRYGTSGFIFCFAFVVIGFAFVYPTRMVREVTLLKGGEKILLETYRPFGLTKAREISVNDISAQWGPAEAKHYLPLKVRGRRFPVLMNQDGIYHNHTLFDKTVGLYRF